MTTGGPDESALGDPVEILLTEWARQCQQAGRPGGAAALPQPARRARRQHRRAATIDAVEMTSWEDLYGGIDPYSLSDWYRYLNCGYLVPAVGGTDKMAAVTAVGTVRTYARLDPQAELHLRGLEGGRPRRARPSSPTARCSSSPWTAQPMGSRIAMPAGGGTVDVTWQVASVTVPMSRVELVVNGEIRESAAGCA